MKTLNNLKETEKYYNKNTNTYEFIENGELLDIQLTFNFTVCSHINAGHIKAWDIEAGYIDAMDINAWDINAWDINAGNINASDIKARNIDVWNINAEDINVGHIKAWDIEAENIKAWDIKARNINYYAVCFSYKNINCNSIKGRRTNSKHFYLDGKITIKDE